jgi:iron complex transport system ATP-binding protein
MTAARASGAAPAVTPAVTAASVSATPLDPAPAMPPAAASRRADGMLSCARLTLAPVAGVAPVLHDITLDFPPGWTAIVGPNGAGKSTLLRGLAGLLPAQAGTVTLAGRPLADWTARQRAQRLAWLAQQGDASGELTVRDVVHLGRLPHLGLLGAPSAADEALVQQAMADTECAAWQHRRLSDLSGGERQRALLARALAVQAPVLLLDEPTTHLDPPHQVALVRLMQALAHAAATPRVVVSVLHDLSLALAADRVVVLAAGRVRAQGPRDDPAVHAALAEVFHHAIRIERLGAHWVAVPELGPSTCR